MSITISASRPWRRRCTGIGSDHPRSTGLLAAPQATASRASGDGGVTSCDIARWYVVNNPSINKPRGHQDEPDLRTSPTGPCPS